MAPAARIVTCDLPSGAYPIHVTAGDLGLLSRVVAPWQGMASALVTDATVDGFHGEAASRAMDEAGVRHTRMVLPPGEPTKSFPQLQQLLDRLLDAGVTRDGVVVALGGGVIGDLVGLAASLLRRGVACVQVPTSLIAQVDASIGGKTAVNTRQGKNLVGTFHQPAAVVAATSTLQTLADEEMRAGMAEVVKYALLEGEDLLEEIERGQDALMGRDPAALAQLVHRCATIKARIVAQDEREGGLRRLLNLGHTVGHAVERAAGYGTLRHGEAVSIGLVASCVLSRQRGMLSQPVVERVRSLLERLGLPVCSPPIDPELTRAALVQDKKGSGDQLRWILVEGPGHPVVVSEPAAMAAEHLSRLAGEKVLVWDEP